MLADGVGRGRGDDVGRARSWTTTAARWLHLALAVVALGGFTIELVTALTGDLGEAPSRAERLLRLFSYFTIVSNLAVGIVALLLAVAPRRDGPAFRVARLDALLCIAVTGVVYQALLRGLRELTPSGALADLLLHVVAPILAVGGWLLVGPRPRVTWGTVAWSVVAPLAWIGWTFARGAATGWYPYPFLDVGQVGWGQALLTTAAISVGFLVGGALILWADRMLPPTP